MEDLPLDDNDNTGKGLPEFPSFDETPRRVLVIEDDPSIHNIISVPLKEVFPYVQFDFYVSGDDAWQAANNDPFDLIVSDWKFEGEISGLALLNRFRSHHYYKHVPILVISGYLQENDFPLMNELNYTSYLLKPFRSHLLTRSLKDLYKEAKWFTKQNKYLKGFIDEVIVEPDADKIDKKIEHFIKSCPRPIPSLLLCSSLLRKMGSYDKALLFALKAQAKKPGALLIDSELGKIYLGLGDIEKSGQLLKRAYDRSPNNLDRLCDLGKISLERLDSDEARSYFESALKIDPECENAKQGVALANNLDDFFKYNNPTSIPENFAGLLNAIGIELVRNGDLEGGIHHYQSALNFITDKQVEASVCFNLGLGYMRFSQYENAYQWLQRSLELEPNHEKSKVYITKVESHITTIHANEFDDNIGDDLEFTDANLPSL